MRCALIPAPALLVAGLLASLSACAPVIEDRPPARAAPAVARRPATSLTGPRHAPIMMVLDRIEGAEAARTRAVFAPIEPRMAECQAGGGGVIRLRLVSKTGSSQYSVEPSTTLDGSVRRCVLETLSTIDVEGISGDQIPSNKIPGFSALFRIEW